ncbi:AAC(3) family N-acetyltransferase [Streptomyces phaeolivaceus]|uniref:AAC(3) family N-acetyltransferase n=2 Tax=Streptomyces phaeolivaceus TaxID=2653200 RepID=A0A5P8KJU4_9ACTN|nr:AAC(3) family N-acetyltransferase [Streptomyces phaeolivaceus]
MVHASMRSLGGIDGGADAVLRALRRVLEPGGTLVVPTFTAGNSDTSTLYLERVRGLSAEAREAFRAAMPPFDSAETPSTGMGILAETARLRPESRRSAHPQTSFAALGPDASTVIDDHHPDCHLGEHSPLARLYDMGAQILLLGVGFDRCTAFHLGEYRVDDPPRRTYNCVVRRDGVRQWWAYEDVALDDSDFAALGADFEKDRGGKAVRTGMVGAAASRLVDLVEAVDYAREWFPEHRPAGRPR